MSTTYPMSKELRLLNLICVIAALGFLAMIVVTALTTEQLLSTDTLFIMTVCLVMALLFAVNPLLHLKSEGKLPVPFMKRSSAGTGQISSTSGPPLLDAKGRAVPPDVRAMVSNFGQTGTKDA
jgi:hypothetical protein